MKTSRILLVEDDLPQSRLMERAFQDAGVSTLRHAQTGHEGLRLFETFHPDVVVIDIMLPTMNGLSLARSIRAQNVSVKLVGYSSVARLAREEDRQVFDAWLEDRANGLDAVMLAPTRELAAELNRRARAHRHRLDGDADGGRRRRAAGRAT